jgi:hypothetical protein
MKSEYLKVGGHHMSSIAERKTSEDMNLCVHQ